MGKNRSRQSVRQSKKNQPASSSGVSSHSSRKHELEAPTSPEPQEKTASSSGVQSHGSRKALETSISPEPQEKTGNSVTVTASNFHNCNFNTHQGTSGGQQPCKKCELNTVEFNLTPPVNIVGREKEVAELLQLLRDHQRVVICGMGGRGKTSLASHCARRWLTDKFIDHVAMIDSETANSLESSLRSFACEMDIKDNENKPIKFLVNTIYNKFKNYKLLLIFDNVVKFADIRPHLPQQLAGKFIIITSQNREYDANYYKIFPLDLLSPESSMDLMKNRLGKCWSKVEKEVNIIEELCTTLQYHPLALILAAAHISDAVSYEHNTFSVKQYAEGYRDMLDKDFPDYHTDIYTKTVYKALKMNIELLQREEYGVKALEILYCMTYMDPSDLDIDYFLGVPEFNENVLNNIIRSLEKYSIATLAGHYRKCFNVHRLILETCRNILKQSKRDKEFQRTTLKLLLTAGELRRHADFLIPEMEMDNIIESYRECYSSGPLREELTWRLQVLGYDYSTVEDWTGLHFVSFTNAFVVEILAKRLSCKNSKTDVDKFIQFINKKDKQGNTCLHLQIIGEECYYEDCHICDCVVYLIDHGGNIKLRNNKGETVLHMACKHGHTNILNIACNKIENFVELINLRDMEGNTCLHLLMTTEGCYDCDCVICDYAVKLIENGGNIGPPNNKGETVLHVASKHGHTNILDIACNKIENFVELINLRDMEGNTCLHLLMTTEECDEYQCVICDCAVKLIEHGGNIGPPNNKGETVLHMACKHEHTNILNIACNKIENFVELINLRDMEGNTCLHLLITSSWCYEYPCVICNCAVKLIEHCGNIGPPNNKGETVLHMACKHGHTNILNIACNKIENFVELINLRDMEGNTCLHLLMMGRECIRDDGCRRCDTMIYFITREYDVGQINKNGLSVLDAAAQHKHFRILEHLLQVYSTETRSEHYHSIVRVAERQHVLLFKQTSQDPAWYRWIPLNPLDSTEEGVELLQRLTQGGTRADYEQVVRMFDNIPLALRMAATYMRCRTVTITDFIQHFNAIPDDDVVQSVRQCCSGYTCDALCKLICIVINNLMREHELMLSLIFHWSFIRVSISKSHMDKLFGSEMPNTREYVELLWRWSLQKIEYGEEFSSDSTLRLHKPITCVVAKYAQHYGILESVCAAIIKHEDSRIWPVYDKGVVAQYLGCSGVREAYIEKFFNNPAAVQAQVDRWTRGMRVLDVGDLERWTALHWSVYYGDDSVMRALLLQSAAVDATAHDDITPLHLAALYDSYKSVKLLCQYGASVNARTAQDGLTPLHLAACTAEYYNIHSLIQCGGDVDAGDKENSTPAHMAALCGGAFTIEKLREDHGADISKKNNAGYSPEMVLEFFSALPDQ